MTATATIARQLLGVPPTFLRCHHFAAFMSNYYCKGLKDPPSPASFHHLLSDENQQRVQDRLKTVKPVRTEKHVPLKAGHGVAAVLVPLCTVGGEPSLLLTLRSRNLVKYRGHVSFPGGNMDASDPDVEFTALRETHEELGIEPSAFTIWGRMNPLPASSDGGKFVHPILAKTGEVDVSQLSFSQEEVEEVFTIPIRQLCMPDYVGSTRFRARKGYTLPVYLGRPYRIWGLTAVIIHMVMNILAPDLYTYKLRHVHDYR